MDSAKLREAAAKLTEAADHLDATHLHGAAPGATAFNWQALLAILIQILTTIAPFLQPVPTPPAS
jgi:hypothetical protein